MNEILLYGGGGHGKVVAEAFLYCGYVVRGIFDHQKNGKLLGIPFLGPYDEQLYPHVSIIISVGDNHIRAQLAGQVRHRPGRLIHPSAVVAFSANVDEGSMVLHRSVIQPEAKIGRHVILNTGSQIDHDCYIGNYVHIGPGAILCGNVKVGDGTLVGAGSILLPGVSVGAWSVIGAGSVIIQDVPDFTVVAGNPGRIIKRIPHEK